MGKNFVLILVLVEYTVTTWFSNIYFYTTHYQRTQFLDCHPFSLSFQNFRKSTFFPLCGEHWESFSPQTWRPAKNRTGSRIATKPFNPNGLLRERKINVQCIMYNVHPVAWNPTCQPTATPFRPSFIIHNSELKKILVLVEYTVTTWFSNISFYITHFQRTWFHELSFVRIQLHLQPRLQNETIEDL